MPFKLVQRTDSFTRDFLSKISLRTTQIGFNAKFVQEAKLQSFGRVNIYVDEENFRLGFKFHNSMDINSLALYSDNPSNNTKATSINQIKKYGFVKKIIEFKNLLEKQFEVKRDIQNKDFWIAQLCPAFEHTASSKSDLKNLKGIYQYKRETGEIVYIGKGNILTRLNSPERESWEFDIIEYSIIDNHEEQSKWESYWLDKFAEKEGRLPIFNKIGSRSGKDE